MGQQGKWRREISSGRGRTGRRAAQTLHVCCGGRGNHASAFPTGNRSIHGPDGTVQSQVFRVGNDPAGGGGAGFRLLENWSMAASVTMPATAWAFTDENTASLSKRFYRDREKPSFRTASAHRPAARASIRYRDGRKFSISMSSWGPRFIRTWLMLKFGVLCGANRMSS